jgi:hypothetical protein
MLYMGLVYLNGQMEENILETGFRIKCMVKVFTLGKMEECTTEIT